MASTLLTAGILLGIVFLFGFLFSLLHKKGKEKLSITRNAIFTKFVSANNLVIAEKEEFNQYFIAIDSSNLKLLHFNFTGSKEEVTVLDLQKINAVKIDMEETSIYENRKGKPVLVEKEILNLQLQITRKDANQTIQILTFYRQGDGRADYNLLKIRIAHWKDKIVNFIER